LHNEAIPGCLDCFGAKEPNEKAAALDAEMKGWMNFPDPWEEIESNMLPF